MEGRSEWRNVGFVGERDCQRGRKRGREKNKENVIQKERESDRKISHSRLVWLYHTSLWARVHYQTARLLHVPTRLWPPLSVKVKQRTDISWNVFTIQSCSYNCAKMLHRLSKTRNEMCLFVTVIGGAIAIVYILRVRYLEATIDIFWCIFTFISPNCNHPNTFAIFRPPSIMAVSFEWACGLVLHNDAYQYHYLCTSYLD